MADSCLQSDFMNFAREERLRDENLDVTQLTQELSKINKDFESTHIILTDERDAEKKN